MNEILPDLSTSPKQVVGNFIISYEQEIDFITEDIKPADLLHFIQTDENTELFCNVDTSFIPRAFTDFDPTDCLPLTNQANGVDSENSSHSEAVNSCRMDGNSSDRSNYAKSFQPDVIVSNSHHRSGPDGSPALLPSKSQGFLPTNMSETGELFAPVKTLTFSDVDQSSHVEDSYADTSRLVSTPSKSNPGNQYTYRHEVVNNGEDKHSDSDSDSDNIHIEPDENLSEFRQLEGEPDLDLISTGAFLPSAHGLNQEFMDNFTGRTGNSFSTSNVFSPLNGRSDQSQQFEGKTPPLHTPNGSSSFDKKSVSNVLNTNTNHGDGEEIQFDMSPCRKPNNMHSQSDPYMNRDGITEANMMIDRQDYMKSDRFYEYSFPNEHTFEPIDKQPQKFMTQNTVPRNLNEYFEPNYRSPKVEVKTKTERMNSDNRDSVRSVNRQGDGYEGKMQEQTRGITHGADQTVQQFVSVSPSAFEQRYLQRTQVSVKLPQAMYDTMANNTSLEEKPDTTPSYQSRFDPPGLPPDSLQRSNYSNYSPKVMKSQTKPSPEKGVDLLQTQLTNLKHNNLSQDQSLNQWHYQTSNEVEKDRSLHGYQNKTSLNVADSRQQGKGMQNGPKSNVVSESVSRDSAAVVTSKTLVTQSGDGKNQGPAKNGKQGTIQTSQPSQVPIQSQQPSSRLLQETISKKSKVNQKFVFSNPALSKSVPSQNKEGNKSQDTTKKPSNATTSAGARKTIMHESEKNAAIRSKSDSMETLAQKQKFGSNSGRYGNKSDQNSTSHPKDGPSYSQNKHWPMQKDRSDGKGHDQGHNHSSHSVEVSEDGHIVTQVQTVSPVPVSHSDHYTPLSQHEAETSLDVRGMEEVRHQLQNMLRLSHDTMSPQERSRYEHSEIVAGFGMEMGDLARQGDISRQGDMLWNMQRKSHEDEAAELFPSFMSSHSQYMVDSGNVTRSDASIHSENQRLRDMVEKERYRRKHCEQYIQQLNVKLLENQQQLAVAVSTDKRKDIMIEQLDKQLAVVMEGWKRRDIEKDAIVADIRKEKEEVEESLKQQQEMINNFEHDMSQAVDALREEKEKSVKTVEEMKEKVTETERSRIHDKELLSAEQEKVDLLQQECDNLRESRDTLDKKLDNMQRRLHKEQDEWFQREQELLQRIEEVAEKNTKILQMERAKSEEQGKLAEEVMDQYQATTTKVKQLELELDAAMREKESVKVEMGIMEAKFENAQRVLEAEMHSTMEKQIADQITDVQSRNDRVMEEIQEKHRLQVIELNQRHGRDMEKQLAVFREEVQKKEDDYRKQLNEMETRLTEYRAENSELKLSKQKLESTRLEILTKLQYAMQSQWNEAFSLLASTPQRKGQAPPPPVNTTASENAEVQSLPSVSFTFPNTSITSHNNNFVPSANQNSPPRQLANQSHSSGKSSNHSSPERKSKRQSSPSRQYTANQMTGGSQLANQSSSERNPISASHIHSTPEQKKPSGDEAIETTTMLHMQQFQDYMNSVAQTPEWISSLNTQSLHQPVIPDRPSPSLPTPPDLAALLSTHIQNLQQQQLDRALSSLPSSIQRTLPASASNNTSANFVSDTHLKSHSVVMSQAHKLQTLTPPKTTAQFARSANQTQCSESHDSVSQSDRENTVYGWSMQPGGQGVSYGDSRDLSCAIPIRPPQQGEDPYLHDDEQSVISSIAGSQMGYFKGGQSFSPPTKENRAIHDDSLEDLTHHSSRLNEDYNHLSERMEIHESHQNELQHYIQMLLNKAPSETGQDDSMYSQDQEEFDMNDTAQAAQLQRELDRIQELRIKQESSTKGKDSATQRQDTKPQPVASMSGRESNKILNPDQMAEIARMLNQVKQTSDPNNHQVAELLELLKHAQAEKDRGTTQEQRKGPKSGPKVAGQTDKNRSHIAAKKNVQFPPAKGVEGSKPPTDIQKSQSEKQPTKTATAQPVKKVERKVAGSATKGDKGPKPAAWK